MILEHQKARPQIHDSAYVAPTATISGDVTIGKNTCVLFGAVLTADGGSIEIGADCVIMENAILRGTPRHSLCIDDHVLVGPRAYLSGCTIGANVFLATGSTVFNAAHVGISSEVRINGVVHVNSRLPAETLVPIGWVAVGDPAEVLPPEDHEAIWKIQKSLDFPGEVFGLERSPLSVLMPELTCRYTTALQRHRKDKQVK